MNNDMKELVLARLKVMPKNIKLHIGDNQESFDKDRLIKEVKEDSEVGEMFVNLQERYIKAVIKGLLC